MVEFGQFVTVSLQLLTSHHRQSSWRRSNCLDISGPITFSPWVPSPIPVMNSHWIPHWRWYGNIICTPDESHKVFIHSQVLPWRLDLCHHDNSGRVVALAQLEVLSMAGFRSVHVYCTCISFSSRKGRLRCSTTQNDDTLSSHSPFSGVQTPLSLWCFAIYTVKNRTECLGDLL